MPDSDFEDRLQRIAANSRNQAAGRAVGGTVQDGPRKLNLGRFASGALVLALGTQGARFANTNYETIRDDSGIGTAMGLGMAALAATLYGVLLMVRALPRKGRVSEPVVPRERQPRSRSARPILSLFGFALGVTASVAMFMGAAARLVVTNPAMTFPALAFMTAAAATVLALLIGFAGLFRRGSSLWKVPLYYVAGNILTFAAFKLLNINLLEWPGFVALAS